MVKISVICVVFNVEPVKCKTLSSLETLDLSPYDIEMKVHIWDNSADCFGIDSLAFMKLPSSYRHSGKNSSLAEAYNSVIKIDSSANYYLILDDDSVITQEYLEALVTFVNTGKKLAVPKIFNSGKLISPGKINGVRGAELSVDSLQEGDNQITSFTAMMSGTIINRDVFDFGIQFDERLTLYGIDTKFFLDFQKKFTGFYLMDVSLDHDSALRNDDLLIGNKLSRLSNLFKSRYIVFCDVSFFRSKLAFYIAAASLKLAVKKREIKYLSLLKCIRFK